MPLSVGLDIASCTGMALVGEGEDRGKTIQIPKERGFLRLQLVAADVERTLVVWEPTVVVVENYAYCQNIRSFITLVELGTVIRSVLFRLRLPWYEVPPTTLKKWVTGKGNAPKDDMAKFVTKRWGFTSPSDDIVDAYALAQLGQLPSVEIMAIPGVEFWQP